MTFSVKNENEKSLFKLQPKVKTSYYNKKEKIKKITQILNNYPEGATPKLIAFHSKINHNTVKTILIELEKNGIVQRKQGLRGYYVLVEKKTHDLFLYNTQNINFHYILPDNFEIKDKILEKGNFSELIGYSFSIGKESQKASIRIDTSYPFNISAITLISHFFKELVKKHTEILPKDNEIIVSSLEINKDYLGMKMEGCNCLTIDTLILEMKLYNKKNRLREEYKTKEPIGLDFFINLARNGILFAELKNNDNSILERLENLEKVMRKIANFITNNLKP